MGLFDAVFSGSVGERWRTALTANAGSGHRLDVRLSIAGAELEDLPWELLYDETAKFCLSASDRTTLVRVVSPPPYGWGPVEIEGPVRVLALGEARTLARLPTPVAFDRMSIVQLTPMTMLAMFEHLRHQDVHVVHLGRAGLDIRAVVADHRPLRLVVLDGADLAPADLVRAGCAAVVAIPTAMSDGAARSFVALLYAGLSMLEPLDAVVNRARAALLRADPHETVLPVVWMSHPATALFTKPPPTGANPSVHDVTPAPSIVYPPGVQLPPQHANGPPEPANQQPQEPGSVYVERPHPVDSAPGGRSVWRSIRDAAAGWLAGSGSPRPTSARPLPAVERTAYPRIDVRAGRRGRPDVVVVEEPFDVIVGLGPFQQAALAQTAGLRFAATERVELELLLTFDPTSLHTDGPTRVPLDVTDDDPYPTARLRFTARYRPDLPPVRRIGVQYIRDGQVVAVAWRRFVVVLQREEVAGAILPAPEPNPLLDLSPLLGVELPDLVLTICASDGAASGEFVWTAYARSPDVVVPDAPRISLLDNELRQFMTDMRAAAADTTNPFAAYLTLVGKATKVGRAIPPGIVSVVRTVVEDPRRREAATVLLLTEELSLPWELAVLDPPLQTEWGGVSPFLGAHAAISRWPLTQHQPRPTPRSSVRVRRAAVLAADYVGVPGWNRLDHAIVEARAVAALFAPTAVTVPPLLHDVVGVLRGVPPADLLHVALHGQFDVAGSQEGLVLLAADAGGPVRSALFLTPDQVENGRLDGGPFVFLNACQVAADKRVLADYAGFASTLLRIGATGVVAPLWNVDDDVAAAFAQDFYAATWSTAQGSTVAEAVRAQRARYTERAAASFTPGITPTLIAFQVFGHPRLRLTHV
ncbi:MAG TPA: CHAT domain-containing protein [Lapillicoccus sp.]|nr:CHAT domain-containing protein [Lapillicoccus sp.]